MPPRALAIIERSPAGKQTLHCNIIKVAFHGAIWDIARAVTLCQSTKRLPETLLPESCDPFASWVSEISLVPAL